MTLFDLFLAPVRRLVTPRPPRHPLVAGLTLEQDDLLRLLTSGWTVWTEGDWDRLVAVSRHHRRSRRVRPADLDVLRHKQLAAWVDPIDRWPSRLDTFAVATTEGHRAVAVALLAREGGGPH